MFKKIIIIVAVAVIAVAFWWLVFFQERGLEKYFSPLPPVQNTNINKDEKLSGNYSWGTAAGPNQEQYKNAVWQAIAASTLAGFPPTVHAVENHTDHCGGMAGASYLRREGCMCLTGVWVEITKNGQIEKIDTETKLKGVLFPIDSAQKAVSLMVLTTRDLQINHGIPAGHTLAVDGGYLVQVVENNTCGCSVHQPAGAIYKVTASGAVTPVAAEIVPPSDDPEVCVD